MDATETLSSQRLRALPTYLFHALDEAKARRRAAGGEVIDLSVGDPDAPTPEYVVAAMVRAVRDEANHRYPNPKGSAKFRAACARFLDRRYGVTADPDRHIIACIGSKEGIAHLPLAIVDPGRSVLRPSLAYPVYHAGAILAGADPIAMPMRPASGWTPIWEELPAADLERAALMWVNFPNNPTASTVGVGFYRQAYEFASRHGIVLASDQAYSELYFEGDPPPSLWQADGLDLERSHAIEFHSLSKAFCMAGWRIGFAVGHESLVSALGKLKGPIDMGPFNAIQEAAVAALENYDHPDIAAVRDRYRERRDAVLPPLRALGFQADTPAAGMFVWARCPEVDGVPLDSWQVARDAMEQADVCLTPGAGFGEDGRHYVRLALTVDRERIVKAMERLGEVRWGASV
ncbi:MAG: aminotransferase class I/II-fold pyridoxal phosphate-dependent enzyme [Planctomycetota bacterium]